VGIVFLANNVASYAFLLAFVLFAVFLSKINLGLFLQEKMLTGIYAYKYFSF